MVSTRRTHLALPLLVAAVLPLGLTGGAQADPPSEEEKKLFEQISDRFDGHAANGDVSVAEVRASLTADQTIPVDCTGVTGAVVDECRITVRTELEAYHEATVEKLVGEKRPAAYLWRCSLEVVNDGRRKIKRITCHNGVMFRAGYLKANEDRPVDQGGRLGRLDNERLLYHELLHGQLLIDAMQDDAGWRARCCRCFPDTGGKVDLGPSDAGHAHVPEIEVEFAQQTGEDDGLEVIVRDKIQSSAPDTKEVDVTVAKLSDFDKESIIPYGVPIENIESIGDFFDEGGELKVRVTLTDPKKPARLMVYVDPPTLGLIELVEIIPQIVALEIPTLGPLGAILLAALLVALVIFRRRHRA